MKKLKFAYLGLFMLTLLSYNSTAQMTKGIVVYDMEMKSANEQVQAQLDMMAGSTMKLVFDDENYVTKMSTPFYISETIYNDEEEKALQLNEAGGMKSATYMTPEELEEQGNEQNGGADAEDPDVEITDETMDIEGYECTKVILTTSTGKTVLWVTDEIKFKPENSQFTVEDVDGFPLRIERDVENMGMKMTIVLTASKIKDEIKMKDPFNIEVPKGYEEMTLEQLKARQAKMRGGQ